MVQDNRKALYSTLLTNKDGVDGTAYAQGEDSLSVVVSSPLNDQPGTNPEELFGLAQSTCLNATIKALLKGTEHEDKESLVKTRVDFKKGETSYYFDITVYAGIQDVETAYAERIILAAEKRCPISKLVADSETVDLEILNYEDLLALELD